MSIQGFGKVELIRQFNRDKAKLSKDISAGEKQTGKRSLWASLGGMIGSELLMWGATTALGMATGGTAAAALKFVTSPAGKALVKGLGFYGGGKAGAAAAGDVDFKGKAEEGAFLTGSRERAGEDFGMMEELLQGDILSGAVKTGALAGIGEYAKASELAKGADQDLSTGELLLGGSKEEYVKAYEEGGKFTGFQTGIDPRTSTGQYAQRGEEISQANKLAKYEDEGWIDNMLTGQASSATTVSTPASSMLAQTAAPMEYTGSATQNLDFAGQALGGLEKDQSVWQAFEGQYGFDWGDPRREGVVKDYMGWS